MVLNLKKAPIHRSYLDNWIQQALMIIWGFQMAWLPDLIWILASTEILHEDGLRTSNEASANMQVCSNTGHLINHSWYRSENATSFWLEIWSEIGARAADQLPFAATHGTWKSHRLPCALTHPTNHFFLAKSWKVWASLFHITDSGTYFSLSISRMAELQKCLSNSLYFFQFHWHRQL